MKKGYIYSILSAVLFGTAGIFVKLALKTGLDSVSLLIHQYIIAVLLMFTMMFIFHKGSIKAKGKELFHLFILGAVGNTFMTVFYYMAFEYLPVAMVTMLLYTNPIMIFIYLWLFKKERFTYKKLFAVLLAFVGCILALNLIAGEFIYSIVGIIFGLLSAIFYAFMNLYTESKLGDTAPLKINAYSTLFSLICLIAYEVIKGVALGNEVTIINTSLSLSSWIYILVLATACEIAPLTLLYAAINRIGSLKVSIVGNLEIPTAMLVSFILLKEGITIHQIIGAFFIIYAVYIVRK